MAVLVFNKPNIISISKQLFDVVKLNILFLIIEISLKKALYFLTVYQTLSVCLIDNKYYPQPVLIFSIVWLVFSFLGTCILKTK